MPAYRPVTAPSTMPCMSWPWIEICERPDDLKPSTTPGVFAGAQFNNNQFDTPDISGENTEWLELVAAASEILWAGSGRRFGYCHVSERPTCSPCGCLCGCQTDCSDPYHGLDKVRLSRGPVVGIDAIWIDGIRQRLDQVTVADHRYLIRLDGGTWPDCNDLTRPPYLPPVPARYENRWHGPFSSQFAVAFTGPPERVLVEDAHWPSAGTWQIDYMYGKAVPRLGQMAVAELAVELHRACIGDKACNLPRRIQTVVRSTGSYTLIDPQEHLDRGRWGLTFVDQFFATYNPRRLQRAARIFRADRAICNRPVVARTAPDNRVEPLPEENLFGEGDPRTFATMPVRSDGLPAQPGDVYMDVTTQDRYVIGGQGMFISADTSGPAVYGTGT